MRLRICQDQYIQIKLDSTIERSARLGICQDRYIKIELDSTLGKNRYERAENLTGLVHTN